MPLKGNTFNNCMLKELPWTDFQKVWNGNGTGRSRHWACGKNELNPCLQHGAATWLAAELRAPVQFYNLALLCAQPAQSMHKVTCAPPGFLRLSGVTFPGGASCAHTTENGLH